ncbi:hypothetical protein Y032_0133g1788 [Ancylostoma ceylanicum]|uniref:Uncharacterized protein n=1 Tax=Ancylostoma ceylanicum TaxID=53326 RepID=A0A016T6D9_9BILA|nr:hypothetical protein Y032_0133g1788 [Ancylostoma ceylanicum]
MAHDKATQIGCAAKTCRKQGVTLIDCRYSTNYCHSCLAFKNWTVYEKDHQILLTINTRKIAWFAQKWNYSMLIEGKFSYLTYGARELDPLMCGFPAECGLFFGRNSGKF